MKHLKLAAKANLDTQELIDQNLTQRQQIQQLSIGIESEFIRLNKLIAMKDSAQLALHDNPGCSGTGQLIKVALESISPDTNVTFKHTGAQKDNQIAIEGIVDSIKNSFRKWKEGRENKNAQQARSMQELIGVLTKLHSKVNELSQSLQASKKEVSGPVRLDAISGWFVDHDKKLPTNLIEAIGKDTEMVFNDTKMITNMYFAFTAVVKQVYSGMNLSTDALFKSTFLDKANLLKDKHWYKFIKPGIENAHKYIGGAFMASHPNNANIDKLKGVEWMQAWADSPDGNVIVSSPAKAAGPELTRTFTKQEALKLLEITSKAVNECLTLYRNELTKLIKEEDEVFNVQVEAYMYQVGEAEFGPEYKNGLDQYEKLMKKLIQVPGMMAYQFSGLDCGICEHFYDITRYQTQLLARIVAEF